MRNDRSITPGRTKPFCLCGWCDARGPGRQPRSAALGGRSLLRASGCQYAHGPSRERGSHPGRQEGFS